MPIHSCKTCSKSFYVKPFHVKRGHGIYCSNRCHYKDIKGTIVECFVCKKKVYRGPAKLQLSKSKKYFCSKSCQTKWRNQVYIGPKHANWKHGRSAYHSVLDRHKIKAICTLCRTTERKVLAIHHIDKNRRNSAVENLAWLCHNCHYLVHHYEDERKRFVEALA